MINVTYIDHMGSDLSVVNSARVSFDKESEWVEGETGVDEIGDFVELTLSDKDKKLVKFLAKHKHTSPFGHAFVTFRVKAPVFVARQLVKHKFLRWNEISRRYVDTPPELYIPDAWRKKADNKKQGSSDEEVDLSKFNFIGGEYKGYFGEGKLTTELKAINSEILTAYDTLVNKVKVCPEQARMILPQSMMTEWYWSGSLDAFADMCNLRLKPDTQYESRLVALQIDEVMKELFPVSWVQLVKKEEEECSTSSVTSSVPTSSALGTKSYPKEKAKSGSELDSKSQLKDSKETSKKASETQVGGGHYKDLAIQPLTYCIKNNIPMAEGSVIKYVTRHKSKNGAEDIKKAIHILQFILEEEYGSE